MKNVFCNEEAGELIICDVEFLKKFLFCLKLEIVNFSRFDYFGHYLKTK